MKNIGLIGLVVALLVVFGGYLSYRVEAPEAVEPSLVTDEKSSDIGAQFLQMKPDSTPPGTQDDAGGLKSSNGETAQSDTEVKGEVSGARDENMAGEQDVVSKASIDEPGVVVSMTDLGFFPSMITVEVGTRVSFVNDGQALHWPASDPHPSHEGLPGFDAGGGVATGGTYVWQFNESGEWGFHDHLDPKQTGKIVVE